MSKQKIELTREELLQKYEKQSNRQISEISKFVIGVVLIHFAFFGYISNVWEKDPGNNLMYVYLNFFNPYTNRPFDYVLDIELFYPAYLSLVIFIAVGILQGALEDFLVYSIKNNLWMIIVILIETWIWYSVNYGMSIFVVIGQYFSSLHAFTNILVLILVYVLSGVIGGKVKSIYYQQLKKKKSILGGGAVR